MPMLPPLTYTAASVVTAAGPADSRRSHRATTAVTRPSAPVVAQVPTAPPESTCARSVEASVENMSAGAQIVNDSVARTWPAPPPPSPAPPRARPASRPGRRNRQAIAHAHPDATVAGP